MIARTSTCLASPYFSLDLDAASLYPGYGERHHGYDHENTGAMCLTPGSGLVPAVGKQIAWQVLNMT
jgi:hypothetical protein